MLAFLANYRPVSNLIFTSKVVEHLLANTLRFHVANQHTERNIRPRLQCCTSRLIALLGLLDMFAAFDCVDHNIFLRRLQLWYGLASDVINWISSFLTGRTQQVVYNRTMSTIQPMLFGVLQGFVLGPLFNVLYTTELESIVERQNMKLHQYAYDCQIYSSVSTADSPVAVSKLSACITVSTSG